jgi:hypothetical protein
MNGLDVLEHMKVVKTFDALAQQACTHGSM